MKSTLDNFTDDAAGFTSVEPAALHGKKILIIDVDERGDGASIKVGDCRLYVLASYADRHMVDYFYAHIRQYKPIKSIWTGSIKLKAKDLSSAVKEAVASEYPVRNRDITTFKLNLKDYAW